MCSLNFQTGLLSGIPQVCRLILALVLSYICDKLLSSKKLSTTSVRKIAGAICKYQIFRCQQSTHNKGADFFK